MEREAAKKEMVQQLQKEILRMQGFKAACGEQRFRSGLGPIESAFPGHAFPTGAVHEFISNAKPGAAATNGFVSGLLGKLMQQGGTCLWISTKRTIFPASLKLFGIEPDRVIFVDLPKDKEALWSVEEALKCAALTAVVGEFTELTFTQSRRLQLAVEESHVTGLIHRYNPRSENTTACVTRWKIKPLPCNIEEGMPGLGFSRWNVDLLKVRNGKPGSWQVEWSSSGGFRCTDMQPARVYTLPQRKTG